MKSSIDYLKEAHAILAEPTQCDFARTLGCAQQSISQYFNGKRVIDDYTATRIAFILKIPEIEVIAAANADRETDIKRKKWWNDLYKKITSSTAIIACLSITYPSASEQIIHYLYIM
jgi:transcriptional regulator with XRE-family HTH domain